MPFTAILPGHAAFVAQVEQQVGFERFIFTLRTFGSNQSPTTLELRGYFAAVLQRGIAAFYSTEAMKDRNRCPLPGELEEHLRPYIQNELAEPHSIGMCDFSVMHRAHNGDLAGLTVTYTYVQS